MLRVIVSLQSYSAERLMNQIRKGSENVNPGVKERELCNCCETEQFTRMCNV